MARSTDGAGSTRGARRLALGIIGAVCTLSLIFGTSAALAATPELKIDPTVTAGYTTVEVSGEVDPKGDQLEWFFETSTDGGENWEFREPISPPVENGPPQPFANVVMAGLSLGTTYKVRLGAFDYTTEELLASPEPSPEFTTKSVNAPSATLDPITTRTDTTAILKATIDPNSPGGLDDAGKDLYATEYEFHCSPECPGLAGGTVPAEASGAGLEVEVRAVGLEPDTEYVVTLSATNRGGEATDGPQTFTTIASAPAVIAGPASALGGGLSQLAGTVNPHNSAITSCYFEYGPTTVYGRTAPCETKPGAVNRAVFVSATLSGLEVGGEYHFQLVAASARGSVTSSDASFVVHEPCPNEAIREEQHATYLPECRAYELVSPVFKEGFAPIPSGFTDDGRLSYLSNGNYADNGNGSAAINGGNQYVAVRSASGWATTALAPSGPDYYTGFAVPRVPSSDLRSSLWLMRRGDQPESEVSDLYVRRPDGVFDRIGSANDPATPLTTTAGGAFFSASDDLSHIAFSVGPDGIDGTYEYDGTAAEQPRLVSVDNENHRIAPGCGTQLGSLDSYNHAISADGRVIFWTTKCAASPMYARVGGVTIDASASRCTRASSDPGGECDADSPAVFEGASADGTRVYFMTEQQLVNADTDSTADLYECDIPAATPAPVGSVNPCPDLREVSGAASGAAVQGVTRISEDGSRAYFVATGVLATNSGANGAKAVAGNDNLYVWHIAAAHPDGDTRFVARLDPRDSAALWGGDYAGRFAQATDDGRYLVFATYARLIDHGAQVDTDTAQDVYRYDAGTGALERLSVDADGAGGNEPGHDALFTPIPYDPKSFSLHGPRTALSEDGGSVVFTTADALSPSDTNGTVDSYLWQDSRVSLISSGKPSVDNLFLSYQPLATASDIQAFISPSGRDIYFTTTAQLTSSDVDTTADVYDARVDGGFDLGAQTDCASTTQGCQPPQASPAGPLAASSRTTGPGNPPRARPLAKVRSIHGTTAILGVTVPAAGSIKTASDGTRPTSRRVRNAGTYEVRVKLSEKASALLALTNRLKTTLRLTFTPTAGHPTTLKLPLRFSRGHGGGKWCPPSRDPDPSRRREE